MPPPAPAPTPSLRAIARDWGRIGCVGFGGPPAHVALLRELCVQRRGWLTAEDFEHGVAATNVLPGPASTQLAIYCAWRLRGVRGALVGGTAFIVPGLVLIVALAALFLGAPPDWVLGVGAGAGAVVAAVAVQAGVGLMPASWRRTAGLRGRRARWIAYVTTGGVATALLGPWLVLVLLACGAVELAWRRLGRHGPEGGACGGPAEPGGPAGPAAPSDARPDAPPVPPPSPRRLRSDAAPLLLPVLAAAVATGGVAALCWTALKVGALSYGGGFVIVPLMQDDAVQRYGWMSSAEFLNAVALGQATPGPVTQTIAVVGYAAFGLGGALLAALVAFGPSFWFILLGADRFDRLRTHPDARAFLDGAGPAAIGAIVGSAIPLAAALTERWQLALLAVGAVALLGLRLGVVPTLLAAGLVGAVAALAGAPLPG